MRQPISELSHPAQQVWTRQMNFKQLDAVDKGYAFYSVILNPPKSKPYDYCLLSLRSRRALVYRLQAAPVPIAFSAM